MSSLKFEDAHKVLSRVIYLLGVIYLAVSGLHFGKFFFDPDKLITNIAIGVLILTSGFIIYHIFETKADIRMLNERQDRLENGT